MLFKFVAQFEHLDLDLALAVVLQYALVWLALAVPQAVEVGWVGGGAVAWADVCEVALNIT